MKTSIRLFLLAAFVILLPERAFPTGQDSVAAVVRLRLDSLVQDAIFQRTQLGLYVYDLTADSALYGHNVRQLMRPASNQKVVTAVVALAQLGTDFQYRTSLYMDGQVCDSVLHGNLYVRAGFDPRFGRDDLGAFMQALVDSGIRRVEGDVLFDVSLKDTLRWGWGWCWDDDNPVLTPLLYKGKDAFAPAMREALQENGIQLAGCMRRGRLSQDARRIATRTHTVDEVLLRLMKDSDNLYAESLFYQIGAQGGTPFAGRKQAVRYFDDFIRQLGLVPAHYQIADGSGLSLYNYLTPELLVAVLRYAWTHNEIYLHLLPSLPVAGEDGTLRKRMRHGSAHGTVFAKTGTVEGVSTLSGYATAPNGHLLCFSVMNQGIRRTSTGRNFQDKVCEALTKPLPEVQPAPEPGEDAQPEPAPAEEVAERLP